MYESNFKHNGRLWLGEASQCLIICV